MSGIDERDVARASRRRRHVEERRDGSAGAAGRRNRRVERPRRAGRLADDARRDPARRRTPSDGREPLPAVERLGDPARHRHSRNPVDRLTRGLPDPLRVIVDWVVTIVGAVAIVLLVKAYVVNPYRIPSSSMEPTLHCAQPASGCEARFSDRVLANRFIYHLRDPRRGEIVVFQTPDAARVKCGAGGTFVKRIIGLPGETVEVRLQPGRGTSTSTAGSWTSRTSSRRAARRESSARRRSRRTATS